jgi:hypothetical protein
MRMAKRNYSGSGCCRGAGWVGAHGAGAEVQGARDRRGCHGGPGCAVGHGAGAGERGARSHVGLMVGLVR